MRDTLKNFLVLFSVLVKLEVAIEENVRSIDHTFGIRYRIAPNMKIQYRGRYNFLCFLDLSIHFSEYYSF